MTVSYICATVGISKTAGLLFLQIFKSDDGESISGEALQREPQTGRFRMCPYMTDRQLRGRLRGAGKKRMEHGF